MGKVESQFVLVYEGAGLLDVVAQNGAERLLE